MSGALLEAHSLSLARKGIAGTPVSILEDISFCVAEGSLSAIAGPSGGGKSSLLRLLNRLEEPSGGRVLLEGVDISSLEPVELRQRIALMPQKTLVFEGSLYDNLSRPFQYRGEPPPPMDAPELRSLLELCGLEASLLPRAASSLSGGQQQRLCLARALIKAPQILLLDEPSSALDPPNVDRLARVLKGLREETGLTILLVSHDLRLVRQLADTLIFLAEGRVLESGEAAELLKQAQTPQLRDFLREA